MNLYQDIDVKLQTLIHLSKKHGDSRRAATIFYLLIRRNLNEKGIKLGFAPLISKKERRAFEYMNAINLVMERSFNIRLFNQEMVNKVQKYEILYLKNPHAFPFDLLKELIDIYYDLRKMDIPSVHEPLENSDGERLISTSPIFNLISRKNQGRAGIFLKKKEIDHVRHFLSQDLTQKEAIIKRQLRDRYDKENFEKLLQYKKMKREIDMNDSKKVLFKGSLKNNLLYQQSLNEIPGFFLIGLAVIFFMISIVLFMQEIIYPALSGGFGLITFSLFGGSFLLVLLYWMLFSKEARG